MRRSRSGDRRHDDVPIIVLIVICCHTTHVGLSTAFRRFVNASLDESLMIGFCSIRAGVAGIPRNIKAFSDKRGECGSALAPAERFRWGLAGRVFESG